MEEALGPRRMLERADRDRSVKLESFGGQNCDKKFLQLTIVDALM